MQLLFREISVIFILFKDATVFQDHFRTVLSFTDQSNPNKTDDAGGL